MPLIQKVQPQQLQLRQQQNAVTVDQGSEVEMCKTNTASTATAAAAAAATLATLATNQNAVVVQTKKKSFSNTWSFHSSKKSSDTVPTPHQPKHLPSAFSGPGPSGQNPIDLVSYSDPWRCVLSYPNSDYLFRRDKILLYSRHGGSLASPCPPKFHFLGVVLPNTCLKSLKQRS